MAQVALLVVAVGVAWLPVETHPVAAVMIAAVVLALSTWGWRHSPQLTVSCLVGGAVVLAVLICSGASGWDPSRAVGVIGLVTAGAALVWLASRSRAPDEVTFLFALGLAGLAVWGIWQVVAGRDAILSGIETLPTAARIYAEERVASHRAFASQPLPSHLAVLLATALPLLVNRTRATKSGLVAAAGVGLAVIGLAATRSPVGIGLAMGAVAALVVARNRRLALVVAVLLITAFVAVVAVRPDVARLEPVALRMDNWRTAIWVFETSPCSGVGLSGFAQASQAVPLEVGNRPAHAHNLVLESLAEFGPAGFLGCLLLGLWLIRVIGALWPRDPAMAVALAVVPLHNLVDFSLLVSGVALPWAVLLGWGVARSRMSAAAPEKVRGRIVLVVAASVGVAVAVLHATSIVVEETAASRRETVDRFDGALASLRLASWRVEPQFLLASSALESKDPALLDRAWAEMESKRWLRPRSAALAERRARVALARGEVSVAVAELWAAEEFGAPDRDRDRFFAELMRELEGDASAARN